MQVVISGAEGCGSRINGTMGPGPLTHPLGPRTPRPRGGYCSSRDRASDLPWGAFTAQTPGAPPPSPRLRRTGLNRGPPPPGSASADACPGEGTIRMGQQYHCHTKCYTPGAAVSVMSSGKPHRSQYLQTSSCGLVVWP